MDSMMDSIHLRTERWWNNFLMFLNFVSFINVSYYLKCIIHVASIYFKRDWKWLSTLKESCNISVFPFKWRQKASTFNLETGVEGGETLRGRKRTAELGEEEQKLNCLATATQDAFGEKKEVKYLKKRTPCKTLSTLLFFVVVWRTLRNIVQM